jgi:hypothetical protein
VLSDVYCVCILLNLFLIFSCYSNNKIKQIEKYNIEKFDKLLFPFQNKALIFLGVDFDTSKYKNGDIINAGDKIGNIHKRPNVITTNENNQKIINEARTLYNNKNYKESTETTG